MPDRSRTLISGGTVVAADGSRRLDVLVEGERIAAVGPRLDAVGAPRWDASGLVILPGLIDAHVHVREPGATAKEDWESASRAALAGGVTTILDMPNNDPPTIDAGRVREKLDLAKRSSVCDFGVYLGATASNVGLAARLSKEIVGLKIYLGSTTGSLLLDDWRLLYEHLRATPATMPVVVHAEDEECLKVFAGSSVDDHDRNRPGLCAELAVAHIIAAARAAGRGAHVAHVSTPAELRAIAAARAVVPDLTCEVCPHHLFLTADDAARLGGWGKVNPPLRPAADVLDLWTELGTVDLVATDHAPHTLQEKGQSFADAPSGFPGLETMLSLLLLGVKHGRVGLPRVASLTSAGPARLFRLQGKGVLAAGYDADIVAVDPAAQWQVEGHRLQTKSRWSPFDGWRLPGRPVSVWRRGEHVVDAGQVRASPGSGRPVARRS